MEAKNAIKEKVQWRRNAVEAKMQWMSIEEAANANKESAANRVDRGGCHEYREGEFLREQRQNRAAIDS